MRDINEIIVHCTATREGMNFGVTDIDRWHRLRGFEKVGYHYIVLLDGTIEAGRRPEEVGAHCKGHNKNSIGVCYVGGLDATGKPKDTRTEAQKRALLHLLRGLVAEYSIKKISGHREYNRAKTCPCFDVADEYNKEFSCVG